MSPPAAMALRDQDHKAAVTWFDRAIPLLEKPLPQEAASELGRHGETFVSMGVSYWEAGQREKSLEMTERGVALMETAVKQSLLDEKSLTVAYGNLATMHRTFGRNDRAEQLESLANRTRGGVSR